ncbi:MAG: hypothetical protein IJ468_04245 [Lachnospiraceae bacterium]|nr:hypothetical protein [Lachnospiraceae bacterium]
MRKGLRKAVLIGGMTAAVMMMAGCYGYGYGGYSSYSSQIPKTTAQKDTLEEFDLATLQREDGAFQFPGLEWGASQQEVEEVFGMTIPETVTVSDGFYADVNHSILLLDKVSLGMMPVFGEDGLALISFYFENVYTAEELDTFYNNLVDTATSHFGEPDEVRPEVQESGSMTFNCETTFWYHQINETTMTSLQIGKTDTGSGTNCIILGVNCYDPTEAEEETEEVTDPVEETK